MAETPIRKIRIDNETWNKLATEAERYGETTSSLVRRTLIERLEQS